MLTTLKATAFKGEVSNEQMMALLIVADQYGLNPWTKEIYAFPDKGGIVPVVGVDGWARIINSNPAFDGMEFIDSADVGGLPEWIECVIYRKDRTHPVKVRERMKECKRGTQPWNSHPTRMLRHKAMIQCARLAFGFAGIYDEDEAQRIIAPQAEPIEHATRTESVKAKLRAAQAPQDQDAQIEQQPAIDSTALLLRLSSATDVDVLDADASLIGALPEAERAEATRIYNERREALA
jgi:phage recombination protein Bet